MSAFILRESWLYIYIIQIKDIHRLSVVHQIGMPYIIHHGGARQEKVFFDMTKLNQICIIKNGRGRKHGMVTAHK